MLENAPSTMEVISCPNTNCLRHEQQSKYCPTIILQFKNGRFNNIEEELDNYISTKIYKCNSCDGYINSNRILLEHLFI